MKRRRHDADNCVGLFVQPDGLPEDARIAVVLVLPERIRKLDDVVGTGTIFFGSEGAAEERRNSQRRKGGGGNSSSPNAERLALSGEVEAIAFEGCHAGERMIQIAVIEILLRGHAKFVG